MRLFLFLIAAMIFALPGAAHAACTSPDGEAGVQIYNSTYNVMQYCDGNIWIGMGGGLAVVPDQTASGACSEDNDQKLRRNTAAPPTKLEICDWQGGMGDWTAIGGGGGGSTPDLDAVLTQGNAAGNKKITGLAAPTLNADAANKAYVDGKFGALTNSKWCRTDGTQVICDQDAPVTTETDPQVGTLTNSKWCRTDGTQVICDLDAPVSAESDPKVGAVTNNKWCRGDGSAVQCDQDAPSGGAYGECKKTAATYTGDLDGFAGADAKCVAEFGAGWEFARKFTALGWEIATNAGTAIWFSHPAETNNLCKLSGAPWESPSSGFGTYISNYAAQTWSSTLQCSMARPILCCKD
jgi:hypothetical protein